MIQFFTLPFFPRKSCYVLACNRSAELSLVAMQHVNV